MSSGNRKKNQAIEEASTVVRVLLEVACLDRYSQAWRRLDDVAAIIDHVFDIQSGLKGILTGAIINAHLSSANSTKNIVNCRANNTTGLKKKVQAGLHASSCVLCEIFHPSLHLDVNGAMK
jgi:hypothetical protein